MKIKIAFLGTGLMGEPMAFRLIDASYITVVYNRTESKTESLKKRGVEVVNTPTKAIEKANLIIVMLTDYTAICNVLFSDPAISFKGKILIQMGTISPTESVKLKEQFEYAGGEYMEAPVLGSIPQVKTGKLFILFGGTKNQFRKWKDLFKVFGDKIIYMGAVGQGSAAKLALNQLIASLTVAFSVSMGYLREKGVDIKKFMGILRESALYAPTFDKKFDRMMNRDFSRSNFPLKHLLKDVSLMIAEFKDERIDVSHLEGIRKILSCAIQNGYSDLDYSVLYNAVHPG